MAFGRSLHAGGSYGRAQAVVIWALENWQHFDAWCCVKGVDPSELNSLRLFNLALFYLREGRDEDALKELEQELRHADSYKHPLHLLTSTYSKPRAVKEVEALPKTPGGYVPSWWRGDEANAKYAMTMMKQLPK